MEKTIVDKGAPNEIFNEFKEISDASIKAWLIKKNIVSDTDDIINYKDLYLGKEEVLKHTLHNSRYHI